MSNPVGKQVEEALDSFDRALSQIEAKVTPFVKKPLSDVVPRLSPTENAKLNMAYGYTLNALFYMLLKTQGVAPEEHPVKKELDRIKRYMAKTMAVEKEIKDKEQAAAPSEEKTNSDAPKTEEKEVKKVQAKAKPKGKRKQNTKNKSSKKRKTKRK